MGPGIYALAGIALAFNLLVILYKVQTERQVNAALDGALLALIFWLFSGSLGALVIGTIASAIISIYLLINPPNEELFEDW